MHEEGGEQRVVRLDDLRRLDGCPASWPGRAATLELPASARARAFPALRRWQLLRDAAVAWHHARRPEVGVLRAEALFASLDAVEREECTAQLAHYRAVVPHGARVDEQPEAGTWGTGTMAVRVGPAFVLASEVDAPVAVRLCTGRSRVDGLASAVLRRTATGAEQVEVLLGTRGGVDEVAAPDPGAEAELARLVAQAEALPNPSRRTSRAGGACYGCQRLPYCGQHPVLGAGVPPPTASRLVVLSKTGLATAARCQRRAAWQHLFHLPADPEVDEPDELAATGVGLAVHEVLSSLVLTTPDEAEAALATALEGVAPADRASVALLARRHLAIEHDEHPGLTYRTAERTTGACCTAPDADGRVAVVAFLAKLDATAREPDGTPAIVEHKTGGAGVPHEDDLYAVLGWHLATRRAGAAPERLAVHHHWLGRAEPARCDRVVHDAASIAAAEQRLQAIAEVVAAWDPADALSPPPQRVHDAHCHHCPFRLRCGRHGGPAPA